MGEDGREGVGAMIPNSNDIWESYMDTLFCQLCASIYVYIYIKSLTELPNIVGNAPSSSHKSPSKQLRCVIPVLQLFGCYRGYAIAIG